MGMLKNRLSLFMFFFFLLFLSAEGWSLANKKNHLPKKDSASSEAVAFLIAANEGEIEVAKDIVKKVGDKDVISFAEFMIKEHTKNLDETRKVSKDTGISPVATAKIKSFKKNNAKERTHLAKLKGIVLERAYIDAMVKGHQKVFDELTFYEAKTSNEVLKKHLKDTLHHVSEHLKQAKEIQAKLKP